MVTSSVHLGRWPVLRVVLCVSVFVTRYHFSRSINFVYFLLLSIHIEKA